MERQQHEPQRLEGEPSTQPARVDAQALAAATFLALIKERDTSKARCVELRTVANYLLNRHNDIVPIYTAENSNYSRLRREVSALQSASERAFAPSDDSDASPSPSRSQSPSPSRLPTSPPLPHHSTLAVASAAAPAAALAAHRPAGSLSAVALAPRPSASAPAATLAAASVAAPAATPTAAPAAAPSSDTAVAGPAGPSVAANTLAAAPDHPSTSSHGANPRDSRERGDLAESLAILQADIAHPEEDSFPPPSTAGRGAAPKPSSSYKFKFASPLADRVKQAHVPAITLPSSKAIVLQKLVDNSRHYWKQNEPTAEEVLQRVERRNREQAEKLAAFERQKQHQEAARRHRASTPERIRKGDYLYEKHTNPHHSLPPLSVQYPHLAPSQPPPPPPPRPSVQPSNPAHQRWLSHNRPLTSPRSSSRYEREQQRPLERGQRGGFSSHHQRSLERGPSPQRDRLPTNHHSYTERYRASDQRSLSIERDPSPQQQERKRAPRQHSPSSSDGIPPPKRKPPPNPSLLTSAAFPSLAAAPINQAPSQLAATASASLPSASSLAAITASAQISAEDWAAFQLFRASQLAGPPRPA